MLPLPAFFSLREPDAVPGLAALFLYDIVGGLPAAAELFLGTLTVGLLCGLKSH